MKYIKLNKGHKAIVDDEDYDRINKYNWFTKDKKSDSTFYAYRNDGNTTRFMHREILGLTDPNIHTDHKNRNGLDNRKCNIRPCTPRQNNMNTSSKGGTSKYKGIVFHKRDERWEAYVYPEKGKRKYVGSSKSEEEAARIYNKAAKKYYGEFAYQNPV